MRLAFAFATLSLAANAIAAPAPFTVTYAVSRDGKVIGESKVTLAQAGKDDWTLTTETHGTAGMARMLGLDVREESRFRWKDGLPEGLNYDYRQDATLKHKQRHTDFDWSGGQAHVKDNDKNFDFPVQAGTVDRHLVSLSIGEALAAGKKEAQFGVAVKDHVEQQQYRDDGEEEVKVPAGSYKTVRVERVDSPGKIRSWYAPNKLPVPVKMEQTQGDKSVIVLELKSAS
jgi:hypothetical protein